MHLERVFQPNLVDWRPLPGRARVGVGYGDGDFRHIDRMNETDVRDKTSALPATQSRRCPCLASADGKGTTKTSSAATAAPPSQIYWGSNVHCQQDLPKWIPTEMMINVSADARESDLMCR